MYSVVIPTLNEKENLSKLLPKILGPDCEVVIADNGSTDGTPEFVEGFETPYLLRITKGTGSVTEALLRGIQQSQYDKIILMDGDLSHPAEVVPKMAEVLDEYDMVVASRYSKGGNTRDTFLNRIISKGYNLLTYPLFLDVKDRASGFFGLRRKVTEVKIQDTYKPMLEFLVRGNPTSVCEVPYSFSPRTEGYSKLGRSGSIKQTVFDLIQLYLYHYRKFVKYLIIGGFYTLLIFVGTYLITEFMGYWYMTSLVLAIALVEIFKFLTLKHWAFGDEKPSSDADYEWFAWFKGNPLQRYWKKKIGRLTKGFLGNPGRLLDVGCGSSPVINLFQCDRVGLDGSQEKLDFIGRYSDAMFFQCDLNGEGMPPFTEGFDAVVCNNVLEHLRNPERVVEDISRRMLPGGGVVITVPDSGRRLTRLVEWAYGKVMPQGYSEDHITRVTRGDLDSWCTKHGLKLVERRSVFTDVVCKYQKEVAK